MESIEATDERIIRHVQAFTLLRIGFTAAPILFGLDKFANVLTDWPRYLAPLIDDVIPGAAQQAMYREAQLALRGVIGARELDAFLTEKDAVAGELAEAVRPRAKELGLELISVGIKNVILPGEMKDLMPGPDGGRASSGSARVEMLKGNEYVRVWINRGGVNYLRDLMELFGDDLVRELGRPEFVGVDPQASLALVDLLEAWSQGEAAGVLRLVFTIALGVALATLLPAWFVRGRR